MRFLFVGHLRLEKLWRRRWTQDTLLHVGVLFGCFGRNIAGPGLSTRAIYFPQKDTYAPAPSPRKELIRLDVCTFAVRVQGKKCTWQMLAVSRRGLPTLHMVKVPVLGAPLFQLEIYVFFVLEERASLLAVQRETCVTEGYREKRATQG